MTNVLWGQTILELLDSIIHDKGIPDELAQQNKISDHMGYEMGGEEEFENLNNANYYMSK